MISCNAISSSAGAAKYHYENGEARADAEYYSKEEVRSAWGGEGAALAGYGIGAPVDKDDFIRVLDGKVNDLGPNGLGDERQLGVMQRNEQGEKVLEHRAGLDFTFSAPKSISIAAEVHGNADVRTAHEKGVSAAMDYLEKHAAQTRVNGEKVMTGNLTYSKFEHAISRELDPQTHTHVVIANMTNHEGKWYSLSNEKLLQLRATADLVYKNEMAQALQAKGYQVEFDGKGNVELAGVTREQIEHFSLRSQQIDTALREKGIDPATASYAQRKEFGTLATRAAKNAPESAAYHRPEWQTRAAAVGISQIQPGNGLANNPNAGREALGKALEHLTEREAAFTDKNLYKAVAQFSEGRATYSQIEQAIKEQQKAGDLVRRDDGKLTTRDMIGHEEKMAGRLEAGRGAHQAVMTDREFDKAVARFEDRKTAEGQKEGWLKEGERFQLTDEQRNASRAILTGNDRFQGVQGLAGTGKTTMLEFVREAAEAKGWQVEGFSNGAAQAQKLQDESGIQSTTTARHLIDQEKAGRDGQLAQRALDTYQKQQDTFPAFREKPDFDKLSRGVDKGIVTREFDSNKRVYFTDKNGNTWTPGLYREANATTSKNLNHLGLTESKYTIVQDKGLWGALGGTTVLKNGGTLTSEAAGYFKDKLDHHNNFKPEIQKDGTTKDVFRGDLDRGARRLATVADRHVLGKMENWREAGFLEGLAARGQIAIENHAAQRAELGALKEQAAMQNGGRVLRVMDEASMSGQRQFNQVIQATERSGARTVFLGDEKQHQGVEAGKAFEQAQQHMPTARLEEINRQKTEHTKEAVGKIVEGKHGEAMKGLNTTEIRTEQAKVEAKWEGKIEGINAKLEAKQTLTAPEKRDHQQYRDELKQAAQVDNKAVIGQLGREYAALSKDERQGTLILTSTNTDRQAINNAVRDELKSKGELQAGQKTETLQRVDRTEAQLKQASSYQKGETVQFSSQAKSLGVEKGERGDVLKTDSRFNTVTVKMESGKNVTFQADKIQGKEVFTKQEREFSKGDRVVFQKNDRDAGFKNGERGTVEKFNGREMEVKMDNGQSRQVDAQQYKQMDHAYASTSHGSQGQTVDRTMIHHNTEAGRHGDRETYVNATRARTDAKVYTQNSSKAQAQAGVKMDKESARGISSSKDSAKESSSSKDSSKESSKDVSSSRSSGMSR